MEEYLKAGDCFGRQNEFAQAAEMYVLANERAQAATCFEKARQYREAAECFALLGEHMREAELLGQAGDFLAAGQTFHREGLDEEAITVLQKVELEEGGFSEASALLADIFEARGQLSLAIKKLQQAIGDRELDRDTLPVFYSLATLFSNGPDPAFPFPGCGTDPTPDSLECNTYTCP